MPDLTQSAWLRPFPWRCRIAPDMYIVAENRPAWWFRVWQRAFIGWVWEPNV